MPRIRSIKPDFFRHNDLYRSEMESNLPLRLSFAGLWTCADKEGRFKWKPVELKLDILPYDEIDFEEVLDCLNYYGFIIKYEVGGREFGYIPTFKDHQRITGSEATSESKIPCPSGSCNIKETLRKQQGNNKDDRKGKGREREGEKEGNGIEPVFQLQKIYDKSWQEYSSVLNGQAKNLNEEIFLCWKKFVDFIWQNQYHEIFNAKFVTPIDFGRLMTQKGFLEKHWQPVLESMLSTGIQPTQNLFFRIPQFMKYAERDAGIRSKTDSGALAHIGKSIKFDKL